MISLRLFNIRHTLLKFTLFTYMMNTYVRRPTCTVYICIQDRNILCYGLMLILHIYLITVNDSPGQQTTQQRRLITQFNLSERIYRYINVIAFIYEEVIKTTRRRHILISSNYIIKLLLKSV